MFYEKHVSLLNIGVDRRQKIEAKTSTTKEGNTMDKTKKQRKRDLHVKLNTANNSSMTQDLDEMKKLGKEMDQAKTGTELLEEANLTQDPKQ